MELSKSLATGLIIAASLLGGCASNHTQDQAQAYSQDNGSNAPVVDTSDPVTRSSRLIVKSGTLTGMCWMLISYAQ